MVISRTFSPVARVPNAAALTLGGSTHESICRAARISQSFEDRVHTRTALCQNLIFGEQAGLKSDVSNLPASVGVCLPGSEVTCALPP